MQKYEIEKRVKFIAKLDREIDERKKKKNSFMSHYKKFNVDRRDVQARLNYCTLRSVKYKLRKLQKENSEMIKQKTDMEMYHEKRIIELETENSRLKKELGKAQELFSVEKVKKIKAQKRAHYHSQVKTPESVNKTKRLKLELKKAAATIEAMEDELDEVEPSQSSLPILKINEKEFGIGMRVCIMNLTSLEVAAQKIPSVIQCVAQDILDISIPNSELPGRTAIQNIIEKVTMLQNDLCQINWILPTTGVWQLMVRQEGSRKSWIPQLHCLQGTS